MLKQEALKTIKLSWPIIIGEITQMSLGLIDSAMVGQIDYHQLAAASLVNSIVNIPYIFGIGMTMAISQMVATHHGANDKAKVSHFLYNGFWLSFFASIIISLILEIGNSIVFHLNQDPEVARYASPFLRVLGWSTIPMLCQFAIKQFTDGLEKTRISMLLTFFAIPLNIGLNWVLIYGHFGFKRHELMGAAYGTLITRSIVMILMIILIFTNTQFKSYIAVRKNQWKLQLSTFKTLLQIGIPTGLQALLEVGAFAVSGILAGMLSAEDQAAHNIALQSAAFTYMVSMGLAQGSSIRIGNAYGRKDYIAITNIGKSTFYTGLLYGIFCAILFICFRTQIPHIFNTDTKVVATSASLLAFAAIFQISDATQAIAVGSLRGVKDVKAPTWYMTVAYWVLGIPVGYLLAFHTSLGIKGLWIGFIVGLTFTSIFLNRRFNKILKGFR